MKENLKTEQEIIKNWSGELKVSICCAAYNHENYIEDALEGFLIQETNFPFEIIIHDDASTDNTVNIIKEYEKKYPNIIKSIYQKENQYSKTRYFTYEYLYPKAKGKYIALCEGDDYWIDPQKLQKQYDAMEKHPEVDLCAHASIDIDAKTGNKVGITKHSEKDVILSTENVIKGDGAFFATASLFGRKKIFELQYFYKFRQIMAMDYTLQITGSLRGGVLYLKDIMSAYRIMSSCSWSAKIATDTKKREEHYCKKIKMLRQLDIDTNGKYTKVIILKIIECLATIYKYNDIFSPEFRPYFKYFPFFKLVKYFIRAKIPYLAELKRQKDIRNVLKNR